MGGEGAPRSGLYPLGAMLYEMVIGRPLFLGHDSVAIIPPVAPTCPRPLEALILRLLAKDPSELPRVQDLQTNPVASQVFLLNGIGLQVVLWEKYGIEQALNAGLALSICARMALTKLTGPTIPVGLPVRILKVLVISWIRPR